MDFMHAGVAEGAVGFPRLDAPHQLVPGQVMSAGNFAVELQLRLFKLLFVGGELGTGSATWAVSAPGYGWTQLIALFSATGVQPADCGAWTCLQAGGGSARTTGGWLWMDWLNPAAAGCPPPPNCLANWLTSNPLLRLRRLHFLTVGDTSK